MASVRANTQEDGDLDRTDREKEEIARTQPILKGRSKKTALVPDDTPETVMNMSSYTRISSGPTQSSIPPTARPQPYITVRVCSKDEFEKDYMIVKFAHWICGENEARGVKLGKMEVERQYHNAIREAFVHDDPMVTALMAKVDCPFMKKYWELWSS